MRAIIYNLAQLLRKVGYNFHEENDPRIIAMREVIRKIGSIEFKVEITSDGTWVAESTNIDGIMSGGRDAGSINETLKDAIFTYFEIPPYLCNDNLVKSQNEPVTLEQRIYA